MAFSFNWAGLVAPSVSYGNQTDTAAIGANAGKALRGYRNREAANEYADQIEMMGARASSRAEEIKNEIARLEARNRELISRMQAGQTQTQTQVPQQEPLPAPVQAPQVYIG